MPTTPEPVVPPTVQADTLNWMREQITRLNDLTVEGAEYEQVPGGRQLRIPKPPVGLWARVRKAAGSGSGFGSESGSASCQPYDWWEQEPIGCGYFQDDEFGRFGTLENGDPAYSIPPDAFIPDDSIVWLRKGLAAITPEGDFAGSGSGSEGVTEPVIQEWYFRDCPCVGEGGSGSGEGAGSGDGCNNMAANFEVRPPVSSLATDLLLTSDPVNGVTVNYKLSELIDAQLLNSPANERFWPGKFHANSLYGSVLADTYASSMTFNMGVTGSNLHSVTLAGNPTLFVSGTAPGQMYGLFFKQDATGGRTIGAWFSGIIWEGAGTPATLASAAGAVTLVRFIAGAAGATHRHIDTKTWAS